MALLDMGAEYHFYGADITCSFPVSNCVLNLWTCLKPWYELIYCVSLLFTYVCLLHANELLMTCAIIFACLVEWLVFALLSEQGLVNSIPIEGPEMMMMVVGGKNLVEVKCTSFAGSFEVWIFFCFGLIFIVLHYYSLMLCIKKSLVHWIGGLLPGGEEVHFRFCIRWHSNVQVTEHLNGSFASA